MKEITIQAKTANLVEVQDFLRDVLTESGVPIRNQLQLELVVEELFVNICKYAYTPDVGDVTVRLKVDDQADAKIATITVIDKGVPFDPIKKIDPDVSLPAEKREIGGLGIFLVKQTVDYMHYEYSDGQNILTVTKNIKL